jgi:hypothetical protein
MTILNWLKGFHLIHEEQMEFISEDMGFIVIRNDGDFKIDKKFFNRRRKIYGFAK